MHSVDILNIDKDFELMLCKPNKFPIGILSTAKITSIKRIIDNIDSLEFEINEMYDDRFERVKKINNLYGEIHEERLVQLNENEYFVIKSISEEKGDINKKIVSASSLEQKLSRINVTIENKMIVLLEEDVEEDQLAILDLLYQETGWRVGHVDELVRFDIVDSVKVKKVRWQESVSDSWYSLLTSVLADVFSYVALFNTKDKVIDFYSVDTLGENLGLCLSYDNYMKSVQKQTSSDNIVTRLTLSGKDEIDIRDVNPLGRDYVEDYSYFIEKEDMSIELINALSKHDVIVEKNQVRWEILSKSKSEKNNVLTKNNATFYALCEEIKVLISIRDAYEQNDDKINAEKIQKDIDTKNLEKQTLEKEISTLETSILEINNEIEVINKQMDRIHAIDEYGNNIFSSELLSELNEFLYYDTYSNTSYLTSKDLMDGGKRELSRRCIPTIEYSIDSVNFIDRVKNNRSLNFKGNLNMGDIVILYDEKKDTETLLYFVEYDYSPSDNTLQIVLSNKKTKANDTRTIADYLKQAKKSKEFVDNKSYIFNQIKYNRF